MAALAKEFEGLKKVVASMVQAYHDPVGYPTIGYGNLLSKVKWEDLSKYPKKTFAECEDDMKNELLHKMQLALKSSPNLAKKENAYRLVAITDFFFNCGEGNYNTSTLRQKVKEENWSEASFQINRWVFADGKKLNGLVKRRLAESALLLKEYSDA
jgi:lysozyme